MDATVRFETRRVGALPVVVAYLEKMKLAQLIDENIPWEADVPLGSIVEVMVCNRLINPKAQYKIAEWASRAGVCDYYDVTVEQLNDDRLGRALERVAKHFFSVQSQLVLHLIKSFNLNVSNIHYDISNVETLSFTVPTSDNCERALRNRQIFKSRTTLLVTTSTP